MRRVEPKVFLVGEPSICQGMEDYLRHIDTSWGPSGPYNDAQVILEFMGRLCYCSWEPGMNANVKKIREDSAEYLANVIKSGHGSVLEHGQTSWVFADVSRVFTHELVRHRAGAAYSQESLRFVRLTDLGLWLPPEVQERPEVRILFEKTFRDLEQLQVELAKTFKLDEEGVKFSEKKKYTSAMRRVAPIGLATTIGASFNFRALRHIIEMRTAGGAEAEIRLVIDQVARIAKSHWPAIFGDYGQDETGAWVPGLARKV